MPSDSLIPLDKCPGLRRISVGDILRRTVTKAILTIIGGDMEEAAVPLQLCAGQDGDCEAAVHAMQQIFNPLRSKLSCWLMPQMSSIHTIVKPRNY